MRALLLGVVLAAGCGGTPKAYVPVDSPLKQWEAPEPPDAPEPPAAEQTPADKR